MKLFNIGEIYEGFEYPYQLKKIAELNLIDMEFWFVMDDGLAKSYTYGMRERFPSRKLIPFAKRCDCDDVACFEIGKPGKVEIIHDYCDPGWEQRGEYDSFWDWFMDAMQEMIYETDVEYSEEAEAD